MPSRSAFAEFALQTLSRSFCYSSVATQYFCCDSNLELHYNRGGVDRPPPRLSMASTRQKLKLDEQSFQGLLAAAYTIQEHNAKRKAAAAQKLCDHCGAPMPAGQQICAHYGTDPQGFRPGERLQRNWASLWLMNQNEEWRPAIPVEESEPPSLEAKAPESPTLRISEVAADPDQIPELEGPADHTAEVQEEPSVRELDSALVKVEPALEAAIPEESSTADDAAVRWQDLAFWKRPVKLRFDRSDLYLVLAIAIAAVALLWVATGTTTPKYAADAQHGVHLTLWERTLVGLGLAEAPDPPVYRGDPSVKVWVDPHTALYYCEGEDLYGKTPDGRFATQREAQMDQFEPSERAACE